MSEHMPSAPIRAEGNKLFVEGPPSIAKEAFYKTMEKRVQILDTATYIDTLGEHSHHAHFDAVIFQIPEGKKIEDAVIYVCKDDFVLDGKDFTDLMPITIRHEIAELWIYAKTGYSLSPRPARMTENERRELVHGLALREEYQYAFEIGKADKYLNFIRRWADRSPPRDRSKIIKENEEAYSKAKARHHKQRN